MATDLEVRFRASATELDAAFKQLAASSQQFRGVLGELANTAGATGGKLAGVESSVTGFATRAGSAMSGLAGRLGSASIAINQGLELVQKGLRAVERVWGATVGAISARGDELVAQSARFGVAIPDIARLGFVAKQANVEVGELMVGYRTLGKALVEASTQGSDAQKTLTTSLGFTAAELEKLRTASPVEAILAVGRAVADLPEGADQATIATQLLGRSYQSVLQLMREGPDVLRANAALAERLGIVMDEKTARAADRLHDALGTTDDAWKGFLAHMVGGAPFLDRLAESIEKSVGQFAAMGRTIPDEQVAALQGAITGLTGAIAEFATSSGPAFVTVLTDIVDLMKWMVEHSSAVAGAAAGAVVGGAAGFASPLPGGLLLGAGAGAVVGARTGGFLGATVPKRGGEIGQTTLPGPDLGESVASPSDLVAARRGTGKANATAVGAGSESESVKAFFDAEQQALKAAEEQGAAARLRIVQEFTTRVAGLSGVRTDDTRRQLDIQREAERAVARETTEIAKTESNAQRDAELATLELKKRAIDADLQAGRISHTQAAEALRAYYIEREGIILAALDREAALTQDPAKLATLGAQGAGAQADTTAGVAGVDHAEQAAKVADIMAGITPVFGAITQASDRMVQGLIQGTLSWRQAWTQAGSSLVAEFANMGVKLVADQAATVARLVVNWLFGETAKTVATTVGEGARVTATGTATTAKAAIEGPATIKSLAMSAAEAAGKIMAAFANLPYGVGIGLGLAAAGAIVGIIKAFGVFHEGGIVPATGPIIAEKGERVLTVEETARYDALRARGGFGAQPAVTPKVGVLEPDPFTALMGGGTTRPGLASGEAPAPGTAPTPSGTQPFLSSAGGLDRVPDSGALIQAHPRETVLSADVADTVREGASKGTPTVPTEPAQQAGAGDGEKSGKGKGDGKGDGKDDDDKDGKRKGGGRNERDRAGIPGGPSAAAVTAAVPFSGGGGGGGGKVQNVKIVGATATVPTKAKGGTVEATIGAPVQTTPADGVTPVQQQGVQQVAVINPKIPVSFNAIQTGVAISISSAPLGIGGILTTSFGMLNAFARGGDVPEDMWARLKVNEMVLPGPSADVIRKLGQAGAPPVGYAPAPPSGAAPTDLVASTVRAERTTQSLLTGLVQSREFDRSALVSSLAQVLPPAGDEIHASFNVNAIDRAGVAEFFEEHGDLAAAQTFRRMNRSNRGLRVRR